MEQVAILARVSTQGQDYERQVVELTDYCQRMNWEVVKVFAAKVSGASKLADREEISASSCRPPHDKYAKPDKKDFSPVSTSTFDFKKEFQREIWPVT